MLWAFIIGGFIYFSSGLIGAFGILGRKSTIPIPMTVLSYFSVANKK